MGDHRDALTVFVTRRGEERQHLRAGTGAEVARRLVGKYQVGPGAERTGDRHTLLLAARELVGAVLQPVAQAQRFDQLVDPGRLVAGGTTPIELVFQG